MTAFTICGIPEYDDATFIIDDDSRIYVHTKHLGFFRNKNLEAPETLKNHIAEMVLEGFSIKAETSEKKIAKYKKTIESWKQHYNE